MLQTFICNYVEDVENFNYNEQVRALKENGPKRLYFIWGPEDYLSDLFAAEIKKVCLPDGGDDFKGANRWTLRK